MNNDKDSQAGHPANGPPSCQTIPPRRILVVDDEPCILQLSAAVLTRAGYEVDLAEDGETGWEALQAKCFDLLITDNNMPKVTGIELIKKLRSEDITLPVIMASGSIPTEELNRHPGLQLAGTLLKPFTIDELLGVVNRVLHASDNAHSHAEIYFPVMTGAVSQTASLTRGASLNEQTTFAKMVPRHS